MKKSAPTLKEKQREFWKWNLNPITGHRDVFDNKASKLDQTADQLKLDNNKFKSRIV